MGRMKKRYVETQDIDDYMKNKFVEEIKDISFSPDEDIYKLNIKRRKKKGETKIEFRKRQNRTIKKFVEKYLYIFKDGKDKPIKLIRQQVLLIADVFYKRKRNRKTANKVIVWASRGGGKGVTISIIIFLLMIWKNKSFIDLAGAQDQAMIVYEYTANFLTRCIPKIKEKLLDGEPLQKKTKLKNGVSLKCIANSPTQTRGKHPPGLVCLLPNSILWTENGPKIIKNIKVGEKVLDKNGKWGIVEKTIRRKYEGKIRKISSFGNGLPVWVTEDHKIWGINNIGIVRSANEKVYRSRKDKVGKSKWIEANKFEQGDILSFPKFKRIKRKVPKILSFDFFWRFLGYWCGDGSAPLTKTNNYPIKIYLGKDKSFFVDDVVNLLKKITNRNVRVDKSPSRPNSIDIVVSSHKKIWNFLRYKVGMSENRKLPLQWLENANKKQLREFLIGIFRTDGSAQFRGDDILSAWSWTGTSSGLATNIMYCLNRLEIPSYITINKRNRYGVKNKDSWFIKIRWDYIKRILLEEDFENLDLPKKKFESKQWVSNNEWKSVIYKVEEDEYDGYVYDLKMKDEHSFGTPGWMILHNCDEACQKDTGKDENVRSAINMVFSEEDFSILIMSTFHVPIGIFQEYWDEADAKGFVKYKWDIYDTAVKCTLPDKCTFCNGRDKNCKFCKGKGKIKCKECFLTNKEKEFDIEGSLIGFSYGGCNGRCLTAQGYTPIENIFAAKSINDSETWTTEFECFRPRTKGPVYDLEAAYDCFLNNDEIEIPNYETLSTLGIDWGYAGQTSIIGPVINCGDHVAIIREAYFTKPSITEIVGYLKQLEMLYGKSAIFADSSHPFENRSLEDAGFELWHDRHRQGKDSGVVFSKWKDWGIGNIRKWFDKRKLKISWQSCNELWQYLKVYKMGDDGKPVKKMDHGPDALLCAMLGHPYVEELLVVKTEEERKKENKHNRKSVLNFGGKGDEKTRQKN